MSNRKMPEQLDLGTHYHSVMGQCLNQRKRWLANPKEENPRGLKTVMGYVLPSWQRGDVWTKAQKIALIESAWLGINIGTYTFNQTDMEHPLDNLLIDGQQRMVAIEEYINNAFPIFGYYYKDISPTDRRAFANFHFPAYVVQTGDEDYLKGYYNLMNFGGTAHEASQRA